MTQMNDSMAQVSLVKGAQNAQNVLARSAIGSIISLVVQYILGMINNLFVKFPETTEVRRLWIYAWTHVTEALHILIGILILLSAPVFLVRAIRAKHQKWVIASAVGLTGIIISFLGGVLFVTTQADPYSLAMSYGFLIALVAYGWGLYSTRK